LITIRKKAHPVKGEKENMSKRFCFTRRQILRQNAGLAVLRDFCAVKGQTPFLTAAHEALMNAARHGSAETDDIVFRVGQNRRYWVICVTQRKKIRFVPSERPFSGTSLMQKHCVRLRISSKRNALFLAVEKEADNGFSG